MHDSTFATQISFDLAEATDDIGVPVSISLWDGVTQGDRLPDGALVFQFFTGNGFQHYVATLSFEDWGGERCPRFAVYVHDGWVGNVGVYRLCQDVAPELRWPGYDAEGHPVTR